MKVRELIERLERFHLDCEVVFVPPNDVGDAEYELVGIDPWDIGAAPGAVAFSLRSDLDDSEHEKELNEQAYREIADETH